MSKKSYKRNQNRLYREIKRRIIAEKQLAMPRKYAITYERKIDTLAAKHTLPMLSAESADINEQIEYIKHKLAGSIAKQLVEDGYIEFYTSNYETDDAIWPAAEIKARLYVVKPEEN